MDEESSIKGPMGVWPFPIINLLMKMVERQESNTGGSRPRVTNYNIQRDEEGRIKNIEIMKNITGE